MKESHFEDEYFEEGHAHDYVWWRLTDESYQPSVIREIAAKTREIAAKTADYYYPDEMYVQGSGYIIEKTSLFTSATEVMNFLSDHAYECDYLIPTVSCKLPTRFFKVVTLETGIHLWINGYDLTQITPGIADVNFIDQEHIDDMFDELQVLREKDFALLHTPDPEFKRGGKVRIIGAGSQYPMIVMEMMWFDHPFSKAVLMEWKEKIKFTDGAMSVREDKVRDKSWVYLLMAVSEEINGYAIVSEKNLKTLTEQDIQEILTYRNRELAKNLYMLEGSPKSLFTKKDKVTWFPRFIDGRKGFLTYQLCDGSGSPIPFEAVGLERPFLTEVNARIDVYFWLEHPQSYSYLDYLESEARKRGYWTFINFDKTKSKFWVYAISVSIEGLSHISFVDEPQLKKRKEYVPYIESAEDPGNHILIEESIRLTLKSPRLWDSLETLDILSEQETIGHFTIIPMVGEFKKDIEEENEEYE